MKQKIKEGLAVAGKGTGKGSSDLSHQVSDSGCSAVKCSTQEAFVN